MIRRRAAAGMALVAAIFLIVALAGLGAAIASLSGVQHDTEGKSVLAAKAYWGARSGLEWGIQRAIAAGSCALSTTFTLSDPVLNGVSVKVECTSDPFGGGSTVYRLSSTATIGTLGTPGYAERRLSASVSNIP
jgi:MSHA biogenesis protein MshP